MLTVREHPESPVFFDGVLVAHLFNFLCCVVFVSFVFLRPVSCVPNVAMSLDCPLLIAPLGFSSVYIE